MVSASQLPEKYRFKQFPPVNELLPHGSKMVLLDRLIEGNEQRITASAEMSRLQRFAENGRVPSYVGLEVLVQTVAAMVGLPRHASGLKPLVGLVLGTRRCSFPQAWLPEHGELIIDVDTVMLNPPLGVFNGSIRHGGMMYLEGEVKAIQPRDEAELNTLIASV